MKTVFIDANVFLRYLTNDDPGKANRVGTLLDRAAAGEIRLLTSEVVLAEVVWVLESSYGLKNHQIADMVRAILASPGIEVVNGNFVARALDHYIFRNIDFIDGYIAAVMEKRKVTEIFSFDRKHMARIKSITRKEP